jgi:phosphomannomutase
MEFKGAEECWRHLEKGMKTELLSEIKRFALENRSPARVVFGTSGWRGEIGTDFTFHNVNVVTEAIIRTLKTEDTTIRNALGISDFDDLRSRGVVVGHDNRFLGPDFARIVMKRLISEGIKVYFGGETTTPEISASVYMLNAACSINITPSHNPSNYQGLKFNPSDGGPAGPEITDNIQAEANRLMKDGIPEPAISRVDPSSYEAVDTTELYIKYLRKRGTIDLDRIRRFLRDEDCLVAVDHVHGASRRRPERLLGNSTTGVPSGKLVLLRTEDDYLFGGVAPEPSAENMRRLEDVLKKSSAIYRIGVIIDPDGDRIRFADHTMQIPMNYFGAMALHFLHLYKGINGVAVKSVGTSNLVNAIAEKQGIPVRETKVGFKNFRPFMRDDSEERAIVVFEESDGISAFNHIPDKDALFGLLLAIEMVATTGKNLSEYLKEIMEEYGYYYPDRSGIEVDRSLVGEPLRKKITMIKDRYPVGSIIKVGSRSLKVVDLITVDGIKIVLDDGSWLMIRPSGTEPKVRFYIEARSMEEKEAIFRTAERLTEEAIKR